MKTHEKTVPIFLLSAIVLMAAAPCSATQAPIAETLPVSGISTAAATLNGSVNPNGKPTAAWFEWGTNTAYGTSTALVDLGSGSNAVPASATLAERVPYLTYHYRVAASNSLGSAYGADQSFGIWTVTNTADSGPGSLREMISAAPPGSTVVATNSGTLVLAGGELAINKDLAISGPGANQLAISGNNSSRVFNIGAGCTVVISGFAIRDGKSAQGANGFYGAPGGSGGAGSSGGGIYNAGNLTLNECAVVNNRSGQGGIGGAGSRGDPGYSGGAGGAGGNGGGIYNHTSGVLSLKRCTLSGNSSGAGGMGGAGGPGDDWHFLAPSDDGGPGGAGGNAGWGGAIYSAGMLSLEHCTVSGNQSGWGDAGGRGGNGYVYWLDDGAGGRGGNGGAGGSGGGVFNAGTLSVKSCSIAYNATRAGGAAGAPGTGEGNFGQGIAGANGSRGGILNAAPASCFNTVVASNSSPSGPDDVGGPFDSLGYNLIATATGATGFSAASNDLLNVAALLEPLADNGGPTLTHLPQPPDSPAIQAGAINNLPATDQRGFPRVFNGRADIGAAELQVWWPIVTTLPATNTVPPGIMLLGEVNPKGSQTYAWFEYGLTMAYGAGTGMALVAGEPDAIHEIGNSPADPLPWMTYHYRAVASNRVGRVDGADRLFTMPAPIVETPSLSAFPDVVLGQGGSTQVWYSAEPAEVDIRVACNNPVLLPQSRLVLGSSSLGIAPDPNHSGSAQVTVTAGNGMQSDRQSFKVTVLPIDPSQLLHLESQTLSGGIWRLRVHDDGTAAINHELEYRPDLSPTSTWSTAANGIDLGGGEYEVDTSTGDTGFYRITGFRMLLGGFASAEASAEEGGNAAGVVVVFNSSYTGPLGYTWTDESGSVYVGTVAMNGTTAVVPLPAAFLEDDAGIGQLEHLTLEMEAGTGYASSGNTESRITIEENDADWLGVIETECGTLAFTLTMLQDNGAFNGRIQSEGFGFFPTTALVQLAFSENTFSAVATSIPLPVFAGDPLGFTNHLDLRLVAANHPGETNVAPGRIEGEAMLVVKVPAQRHLDAVQTGRFVLDRPPTAASTNEVPLHPIP